MITDAEGTPLVIKVSPANLHDSKPAIEMLDGIPPIQGPAGRPRFRPEIFQGDRAYGTTNNIAATKERRVRCLLAVMHSNVHGSGLGSTRWVVERTLSWMSQERRLRQCYERSHESFEAFHVLKMGLICAAKVERLDLRF